MPVLLLASCGGTVSENVSGSEESAEASSTEQSLLPAACRDRYGRLAANCFTADLNGDGRYDVIELRPATNSNQFWVSLFNPTTNTHGASTLWLTHGGAAMSRAQVWVKKLNGDKLDDLIVQGFDNTFWVSISRGTSFYAPKAWVSFPQPFIYFQTKWAHVGGDSREDIILQTSDNRFMVSLLTTTGFTTPTSWFKHGGTFGNGYASYADFNGDGRKDLAYHAGNSIYVSISSGSRFNLSEPWTVRHGAAGYVRYIDLNADGKVDIAYQNSANQQYWDSIATSTGFRAPVLRQNCRIDTYENWYTYCPLWSWDTAIKTTKVLDWRGKDPATCKGRGEYGSPGPCGHLTYKEVASYGTGDTYFR